MGTTPHASARSPGFALAYRGIHGIQKREASNARYAARSRALNRRSGGYY
jgi:hypothetical protein